MITLVVSVDYHVLCTRSQIKQLELEVGTSESPPARVGQSIMLPSAEERRWSLQETLLPLSHVDSLGKMFYESIFLNNMYYNIGKCIENRDSCNS